MLQFGGYSRGGVFTNSCFGFRDLVIPQELKVEVSAKVRGDFLIRIILLGPTKESKKCLGGDCLGRMVMLLFGKFLPAAQKAKCF